MSPLNNFHDFGKYGGCDYIKIHGEPSKKYHPYPAIVFVIIGKYINVPDMLMGPLKYASETINIEQLFIPKRYSEKYYNTGVKELALVTGSCASITISAITLQFVIDMKEKYKSVEKTDKLYKIFRDEYDRRIHDYLCGKGITDKIDWFDNKYFKEPSIYNIGNDKCSKKIEHFYSNNSNEISCKIPNENYQNDDEKEIFCKENPDHKCC